MCHIVFIGADAKARQLTAAIRSQDGNAEAVQAYPFTAWLQLLKRGSAKRGDVIVIRFLNDHPSLLASLIKPFGDAVTIMICVLRGVRIFWLCHNVNRETESYWPLISWFRRWLWARRAERIVIDDPSLMAAAQAVFLDHRSKLWNITLGPPDEWPRYNRPDLVERARTFMARPDPSDPDRERRLHILVAGISGSKYLHFELLPKLEPRLRELGWDPRILVITRFQRPGGWSRGKRYGGFIDWCERTPTVLLLRDYIDIDEREWVTDVDLIWRAMADWSFPFTLFNAARARIPVLSYQSGHTGALVEREGIGAMVDWSFGNLGEAVNTALATPSGNFEAFLAERTWDIGARRLMAAVADASTPDTAAAAMKAES